MATDALIMKAALEAKLRVSLSQAELVATPLPGTEIALWLLSPDFPQDRLTPAEIDAIWQEPAYWCFCWASGLMLAQWLAEYPETVRGKTVLDFGAGSGVVAVAAAKAGAARVIACDIDPLALASAAANAALNEVVIELSDNFFTFPDAIDLIVAADVLYDRENHPFLDQFRARAAAVLVADSRVKNFQWPGYRALGHRDGGTLPDLNEFDEFRRVNLYRAG